MNRSFMLLPKINSKFFLSIFLVFSNFWIYKILTLNILAGAVVIFSSLIILLNPKKKILILALLFLAFLQFQTTQVKSLVLLDNDEQRVQSERSKSYPPTYIDFRIKVLWLKPESWIEKNNLVIALSRLEENLYTNLDLNRYFFGGFPRNKPGDFEKFPFAYLPFFILGIYALIKKKFLKKLGILWGLSLVLLTYIGTDNRLGPFILFPFFVLSILNGIAFLEAKFKKKQMFYFITLTLVLLVFVLQISYGKN